MSNPNTQELEIADPELKELYESAKARSHEELALAYARLLYVLERAAPDVKDWILGIGKKIRIMRRDWNAYVGYLVGFSAAVTHVKLDVTEMIKQWDQPVDKLEKKIVELPAGSIVLWEWIEEEAEVPKQEGK